MAKPKAPRWLTEAFRDGVDEREAARLGNVRPPPTACRYIGPMPWCWLAQHDPRGRPCTGRLERFHFIGRQRVEHALGALFDWGAQGTEQWNTIVDLILQAAWDPRNGGIGCEGHHRRLDNHAGPGLVIDAAALPLHVIEFATDWGLETSLAERYPSP